MERKQGVFFDILNIIILTAISYISACNDTASALIVLLSSSVAASVFASASRGKFVAYQIYGCICFIAAWFLHGTAVTADSVISALIAMLNLYLPAFAVTICFGRKDTTALSSAAYVTIANIFVLLLSMAKIKFYDKTDMYAQLETLFNDIIGQYSDLISSNSSMLGISSAALTQLMSTAKQVIIMMIPSMLIASSMVCAYFVTAASRGLLGVYAPDKKPNIGYFSDFHMDGTLCKISLALLIIAMFSQNLYLSAGIYNFLAVAVFLYFADGLAIVNFAAVSRTNNRPLSLLITAAVGVVAFTTVATLPMFNGMTILFLLGIIDSGRDFRRTMKAR